MKTKIITLIIFIAALHVNAEIRFVSKSGSSSPPYTSWATAADSLQKAVDICNFGDTVYVGNGVYKEKVVLKKGISFFGSGIDSCIIDTRTIFTASGFYAITNADSCHIKNFNIIVANLDHGFGINNRMDINYSIIEFNKISEAACGFEGYNANFIFKNNLISHCDDGVNIITFYNNPKPYIISNIIDVPKLGTGIISQIGAEPTITNNTITIEGTVVEAGIFIFVDQPSYIYNNIVIGKGGRDGIQGRDLPSIIRNNLVLCNFSNAGISHGNYPVENNIMMNSKAGFVAATGTGYYTKYNDTWNVKNPYTGEIPDSTNISKYPMFVCEDSLDFHLQMYSPMIDAGNPEIKDADGSRSDIGPYGGPFGESYSYKDLAPKIPVNVSAVLVTNTVISLKWNKNYESDLKLYKIYADTLKGFKHDSTKLIGLSKDTSYTDNFLKATKKYYKISAIDNQGNESAVSEEVGIEITGINQIKIIAEEYKLYNNYPNPFNPTTKIGYRLKERGRVKLYVYDIKGALVEILVNHQEEAGYHEAEFRAKEAPAGDLASGIYLYRLDIINSENIPVFTDMKKMLLLK